MKKRTKLLVYAMSLAVAVSAVLPSQVRAEQVNTEMVKAEQVQGTDAQEKPEKAITLKVGRNRNAFL